MTDLVPVRRALISLSEKSGLGELAAGLARHNVEIISTGGREVPPARHPSRLALAVTVSPA